MRWTAFFFFLAFWLSNSLFSDPLRDRVEVGPFVSLEFGMDEFTVDANFERTAIGQDQFYLLDSRHLANSGRQTDGTRFVISDRAEFDRDFRFH